jgi:uncharacterized membrane protein
MSRRCAALLVALFILALASSAANAQPSSSSVTLSVFGDGTVAVSQTVSTSTNDTSINLQLLSPVIANPVAFDQSGSSLYFQITGSNITVYTIGATGVTVQYDTAALTSKQGTVWTLAFLAYYNTTVVLPQQSILTSVSGTPDSLSTSNGSPVVVVPPGSWELNYGLPISIVSTTVTSSTAAPPPGSTSSTASSSSSSSVGASSTTSNSSGFVHPPPPPLGSTSPSPSYVQPAEVLVIALIVAAVVTSVLLKRRRAPPDLQASQLRPDDIKVVEFIAERGGKVLEPEIRTRFALPKTSAWRQIKRLERLGYVKVTKVGSQNQVELLKGRQATESA